MGISKSRSCLGCADSPWGKLRCVTNWLPPRSLHRSWSWRVCECVCVRICVEVCTSMIWMWVFSCGHLCLCVYLSALSFSVRAECVGGPSVSVCVLFSCWLAAVLERILCNCVYVCACPFVWVRACVHVCVCVHVFLCVLWSYMHMSACSYSLRSWVFLCDCVSPFARVFLF